MASNLESIELINNFVQNTKRKKIKIFDSIPPELKQIRDYKGFFAAIQEEESEEVRKFVKKTFNANCHRRFVTLYQEVFGQLSESEVKNFFCSLNEFLQENRTKIPPFLKRFCFDLQIKFFDTQDAKKPCSSKLEDVKTKV